MEFNGKKISRQTREAFRQLLEEQYQLGTLTARTKWKEFLKSIKDDERYKNMVAPQQMGSLPSELFGDFMDDLEEKFDKEKKRVKEIIKENKLVITPKTTKEEFLSLLSTHPKSQMIDSRDHQALYDEFIHKMEREEKKANKG